MSANIIDPAVQPANLGGACAVLPRAFPAARPGPASLPQLTQRRIERSRVLHSFDRHTLSGGHCRQTPHPDIDTNTGTR
jgi:hypothetical protein